LEVKVNQKQALVKAEQLLPGTVPPQAQTVDKEHGRIEERQLWCVAIDPSTVGLAGAAQLICIRRRVETIRQGQVIKETIEITYLVISLWVEEATPQQLFQWARVHWSIENGQHFRRDRTQDEGKRQGGCTLCSSGVAAKMAG